MTVEESANERMVFGGMIKEKGGGKEAIQLSTLALRFEEVLNVEPGKVQLCHALKVIPRGRRAKLQELRTTGTSFSLRSHGCFKHTHQIPGRGLADTLDMQRQTEVGWKSRLGP